MAALIADEPKTDERAFMAAFQEMRDWAKLHLPEEAEIDFAYYALNYVKMVRKIDGTKAAISVMNMVTMRMKKDLSKSKKPVSWPREGWGGE